MTTYLGIDYGLSHLGLALADGPLAQPLYSLKVVDLPKTLSELSTVLDHYHVNVIILGLPEGKLAPVVKAFARSLTRMSSLPIYLHPETLSTKEALIKLRSSGASQKKLQNDHVYAACLILEDYLEAHTPS